MIDEAMLIRFFDTDMRDFLKDDFMNNVRVSTLWTVESELDYWMNRLKFDGLEFTLLELLRLYDREFPEVDPWMD